MHNVTLAGVVAVIAAGNDREDFGLGTTGSPGTAPDAISVAATSNSHVFAPALSVVGGPPNLGAVPLQSAGGAKLPGAWSTLDQAIVDVRSVVGTDGKPVESHLCGSTTDPNGTLGTLPKNSVTGKILLADRGTCTFISKAQRAQNGGAAGLILIDNRFGEANPIPVQLPIAGGMISDLDGKRLRALPRGERRTGVDPRLERHPGDPDGSRRHHHELLVRRPDRLRPLPEARRLRARPRRPLLHAARDDRLDVLGLRRHVDGDAARRRRRGAAPTAAPTWTPAQVKSALMSTAGAAWGDTARTQEAPVLLEGAGLANVHGGRRPEGLHRPAVAVVPARRRLRRAR